MPILAEPLACALVVGTGVRDQAPEMARVIEAPQMHQLMNQHVFAHRVGHQHETPVEADVTRWRARSPTRALIPYADTRHYQAVMRREPTQLLGQLACRLPPELQDRVRRMGDAVGAAFANLRSLALDPRALLFGEQLGISAGSPSRNGDTDASIGPYPYDIAPGRRVADEIHERINIQCSRGPTPARSRSPAARLARAAGAIVPRHGS